MHLRSCSVPVRRLLLALLAVLTLSSRRLPTAATASSVLSSPPATLDVAIYLPLVVKPTLPLRAAFYYPWFPNAWDQGGVNPYTNYHPTLGYYDGSDPAIIAQHIRAMQYGNIAAGIASWWGQGHHTDNRLATILTATAGSSFRWSIYYEPEGQGNPSVSQITSDLIYLRDRYGNDTSYLRLGGRFVVFVYNAGDNCEVVDRWKQANTVNAYLVLKVFTGYRTCLNQPDGWHQYTPAVAADSQGGYSYSISPGFWKVGESPRLSRDLTRWQQNIRDMTASGAPFQLIMTFNEWGEGTAVESADEWASASGYGAYLEALHNNGSDGLPPTATPGPDPVLVGAGDIAGCASLGDEATAELLDGISGTVFAAGDNAYESGTAEEFANCYTPSWGRHKARTRPAVGNHDYLTSGASGYFDYFGAAAGDPSQGYYSYDLGAWHVLVLNSNCSKAGGCGPGSPQYAWLQADLNAHSATACTVAFWHHPLYTAGPLADNDSGGVDAFWPPLYAANADVVVHGHDHNYQRWAPMRPDGSIDLATGIRQFVVGTGGKNHTTPNRAPANLEVENHDTFGVLKLTLHATGYDWQFIPEAGKTFTDSGSGACH